MKHVFIIGSKSVGQYGGFETFVSELIDHNPIDSDVVYHVACKANGSGCLNVDELDGVQLMKDGEKEHEYFYKGAYLYSLNMPNIGSAVAIYYDVCALKWAIAYCKQRAIEKPDFYILACRIGPFIGHYKRQIEKLGGRLFVNPDGHEWMRRKWSKSVRKYWKFSEQLMVKHADCLICDSKAIESYIQEEYAKYHPQTMYLSYGADVTPSSLSDTDEAFTGWLDQFGIIDENYYLVVGRLVPENNYDIIIREFMNHHSLTQLVFVTNNDDAMMEKLKEKVDFFKDERIIFTGPVYDSVLLKKIRERCFAYIHGHEVGGTNPSLLESLASTDLNLLYDVSFNIEVALDSAFYWSKSENSLKDMFVRVESLTKAEKEMFGKKAKARIEEMFNWDKIVEQYNSLFANG